MYEKLRPMEHEDAFRKWILRGKPEADEQLFLANVELIKAYVEKYEHPMCLKLSCGNAATIIEPDVKDLYNFCFDYIFDADAGNFEHIKSAANLWCSTRRLRYLKELDCELKKANCETLIWS